MNTFLGVLVVIATAAAQFTTEIPGCFTKEADIVFLLDSSNSEGAENFEKEKDFVSTFVQALDISPQNIQISVVTFESNIHNQFDLNTYDNKADLLFAISNISFIPGNTLTEKALNFVRTESFTNSSGDRPDVGNILVVITDGQSTDRNMTLMEAEILHNTSTKVLTVGIGQGVDADELKAIASAPENAFTVPDFNALATLDSLIGQRACVIEYVPTTTTPQPTTEEVCYNREADIVFVLDTSNSQGPENFEDQKKFVSNFVESYAPGLGSQGVQISVITFESNVYNQFDLDEYYNKTDLIEAIRNISFTPGNTFTNKALKFVREHSFTAAAGDRSEAPNILVVLTDGQSTDKNETLKEAAEFHSTTSARVISIGIGADVDQEELKDIASSDNLVFNVPNFAALSTIESQIGRVTCITTTIPTTTPICNQTKADIVFVVDSSNSLGEENFKKEVDFIKNVISAIDFDNDNIRVGLVTFQSDVTPRFNLGDYANKSDIFEAIDMITYERGNTLTDRVLAYVRDQMFKPEYGDRPNVTNIMVLMTDGESTNPNDTIKEADLLKQTDIEAITIGIGNLINMDELKAIASSDNYALQAADFVTLNSLVSEIGYVSTGCNVTVPMPTTIEPPTTPRTGCGKADIVFLIDSSNSVGPTHFKTEKEFVTKVVDEIEVGTDKNLISVIRFNSDAMLDFPLNKYSDKADVISAINQLPFQTGNTATDRALEMARNEVFSAKGGDREEAKNIIVVLTDGASTNPVETALQAEYLRNESVLVITIAIGPYPNKAELINLASEDRFHFEVQDFHQLSSIVKNISFCRDYCENKMLDIMFALDSSNSVGADNFNVEKNFLKQFARSVVLDRDHVQIGLVTFGSTVRNRFDLDTYNVLSQMENAIDNVEFSSGNTNTGGALEYILRNSFRYDRGDRMQAPDLLILISDGESTDKNRTHEMAEQIHYGTNIEVVTLGIGQMTNLQELAFIASNPQAVFNVPDYSALKDFVNGFAKDICMPEPTTTTEPRITTTIHNVEEIKPTQAPCQYKKVDIVFLLDTSNSEGPENFQIQKNFARDVSQSFQIGKNDVHVGMATFASDVFNQFNLSTFDNRHDVLEAIQKVSYNPGNTITSKALKYAREVMFSAEAGDRPDVQDLLIVLTDGQPTDRNETEAEANLLHSTSTKVIAIGIGAGIDASEIDLIASEDNLGFEIPDFAALRKIQLEVEKLACTAGYDCSDNEDCESYGRFICMRYDPWARQNCAKYCGYCR